MKDKIEAWFEGKEATLAALLSRLVAIDSQKGPAGPGAPFGPGPRAALDEALCIARELGLDAHDYDHYVGTVDLNDKETNLHILSHLDVVPPGVGWTVTGPFQPLVKGDLIYGRGTDDDKGPTVAALLALQAVKELGIPLKHNVRLIMGTDEECGSGDIAYYYSKEPFAPYTFSPDAGFPLINVERGFFRPTFTRSWDKSPARPQVVDIHGDWKSNVIPPFARAVVAGLSPEEVKPAADAVAAKLGVSFDLTAAPEGVAVQCNGVGGHAASPESANNSLTALLAMLSDLPLADCPSTQAVRALAEVLPHGDFAGATIGIAQSDEVSGGLTLSFTTLTLTETGAEGLFDSRVPICANEENCKNVAAAALAKYGFAMEGGMHPAHHTPLDSPFVRTLLKCYRDYTGDDKTPIVPIGGGTYVHDIPGGVAFGSGMPGFCSNVHGPDERASLHDLVTSAKIFTQVIYELCGA